nr:MAG TPA: hypothetical protein [Caudoviricetes sp.]
MPTYQQLPRLVRISFSLLEIKRFAHFKPIIKYF